MTVQNGIVEKYQMEPRMEWVCNLLTQQLAAMATKPHNANNGVIQLICWSWRILGVFVTFRALIWSTSSNGKQGSEEVIHMTSLINKKCVNSIKLGALECQKSIEKTESYD